MATPRLAKVRLIGSDGGPLYVDVRTAAGPGEARPAVVVCHGFKGFKDWGFFPKLAERLALAGFTAITFNFSGSGVGDGEEFDEPERWGHQRPSGDLDDIRTVVDFVADGGSAWVGLVGHSRGGGLAVLHAARDARVRALVTWAAVGSLLWWPDDDLRRWRAEGKIDVVNTRTGQVLPIYRDALDDLEANGAKALNVPAAAGRVTVPWLIVHGTEDTSVPPTEAEHLRAASRSPATELWLVEGAGHTFGAKHPWAGSTPDLDQAMDRTVRFLSEAL